MNFQSTTIAAFIAILTFPCAGMAGPEATERWTPLPPRVTPGEARTAPSDALILFDGKDLAEWHASADPKSAAGWLVADGVLTVRKGAGNIQTRRLFTDYQLHLEWRVPAGLAGQGQQRGNSGLFLASTGRGDLGYELQILACGDNPTYANGQAGSIYKQHAPMANACAASGSWQSYDVVWRAPRFHADGSLAAPAHLTAFHNGVLIHDHVPLSGTTVYDGAPSYRAHGAAAIKLQDHGDPVNFRNIWVRPIGADPALKAGN
ncbi:MAG: DUF1080 domain-containing protein [Pseudomonadota bacterium]